MTNFRKIAIAKARVAQAEDRIFAARLQAIREIMNGASAADVMILAADVLMGAAPECCEVHREAFQEDFRKVLAEALAAQEDDDGDEDNAPALMH
jgi:hypothetical protein